MSQSLIHQVSVSDVFAAAMDELNFMDVSIPYSSGLSFRWQQEQLLQETFQDRLNPLFIRSQFQIAAFFQPINTDT